MIVESLCICLWSCSTYVCRVVVPTENEGVCLVLAGVGPGVVVPTDNDGVCLVLAGVGPGVGTDGAITMSCVSGPVSGRRLLTVPRDRVPFLGMARILKGIFRENLFCYICEVMTHYNCLVGYKRKIPYIFKFYTLGFSRSN